MNGSMQELARAVAITESICELLGGELVRAREQRHLIRNMDAERLLASARQRDEANGRLAGLEAELARALGAAGQRLGIETVTLEALGASAPEDTADLRDGLGQVRALASALNELDQLNRQLAERALLYVRSYIGAILPRSAAYDRRGAATADVLTTTSSRTA